ncbi:MAG TPA: TonB-dependent receptor [Gemmatimonadaceae bacterium]|nr:TonB-dependent receptor [Gemmatimonadaceae bacterium]
MKIPGHIGAVLLVVLLAATTTRASAQERVGAVPVDTASTATLVGQILDSASRKPLSQAKVILPGTNLRTTTDLTGNFVFRRVPAGRYSVEARRIGYEPAVSAEISVPAGEQVSLTILMRSAPFRLADVTVTPGAFSLLDAGPALGQTITRAEIEAAPFGEDLFRAMSRIPGLSSGDYGAQFSIRGGRQDETLILLDGLEIYEPYHLKDFAEGALSIVDVETIDRVELLTGGFPAHYGDKRSGVMKISSRAPSEDGTHLSLGASLINAHALAEGTFANRNGSWLLSGRRGFADILLRFLNKKEAKAPTYEDVFGTIRYRLHPNHTLALNVLQAADHYRFTINGTTGFNDSIKTVETANNGYGNSYAWLTLRSLLGEHLTLNTLASVGSVNATRRGDERHAIIPLEYYGVNGRRAFSVIGLKQDFSYQGSERNVLDLGYDLRSMHADFDWENRVTQNPDNPVPDTTGYYPRITRRAKKANGTTIGAYVSDRMQLAEPLVLEAGLRYDGATYTHDRDWSPRINTLFRLSDRNSLRAGWGYYYQRQGINDENAFDRLNRYFPSERSKQWSIGFEHTYSDGGTFRAEAYRKTGSRLRPILRNWKSGLNVFPESSEDRILVYPDSTWSKGLEIYHERSLGSRAKLRLGYALSRVDERVSRIDHVNDPIKPPFDSVHSGPQDQRHALNMDLIYRPSSNWTVTTAYTFHTGWPYTYELGVPVTRRNGAKDLLVRPDTLYNRRLPAYQRVDMRVTRRKQTPNSEWRFFFEVINLTNHENVLGYDVYRVTDASGSLALQRDPETWFSILPSLGVSWSTRF